MSRHGVISVAALAVAAVTIALLAGGASADVNPFSGQHFYLSSYLDAYLNSSIATATGQVKANLQAMKNVPRAVWIDRKSKLAAGDEVEQTLATAAAQNPPQMVVFIVYNVPNRDCHALASAGEICCTKNSDGSCNYNQAGDCADGLADYRSNYIDAMVKLYQKYSTVPLALIIEPDSLPNLATNKADPRCGNTATVAAYTQGIPYAVKTLATQVPRAAIYIDAAHGGWLGWKNNAQLFAQIIQGLNVFPYIRGFSTNVANYQPLGIQCPSTDWCLNSAHPSDPCCGDPCRLLSQWNPGNGELNYAAVISEAFSAYGFSPKFVIDTGRNGVVNMRGSCSNWCNIRNAGAGIPFTTDTANKTLVDAYFWFKFPGESDGCTPTLPDGTTCSRADPSCSSADSIGSQSGEPKPPQAGGWFDYAAKQMAANAAFSVS